MNMYNKFELEDLKKAISDKVTIREIGFDSQSKILSAIAFMDVSTSEKLQAIENLSNGCFTVHDVINYIIRKENE